MIKNNRIFGNKLYPMTIAGEVNTSVRSFVNQILLARTATNLARSNNNPLIPPQKQGENRKLFARVSGLARLAFVPHAPPASPTCPAFHSPPSSPLVPRRRSRPSSTPSGLRRLTLPLQYYSFDIGIPMYLKQSSLPKAVGVSPSRKRLCLLVRGKSGLRPTPARKADMRQLMKKHAKRHALGLMQVQQHLWYQYSIKPQPA